MYYLAILDKAETKETITGSDRQFFIKYLKTVRGVLNRYKETIKQYPNYRVEIYTYSNPYDDDSYKMVYRSK
jgi:hypothetical protein